MATIKYKNKHGTWNKLVNTNSYNSDSFKSAVTTVMNDNNVLTDSDYKSEEFKSAVSTVMTDNKVLTEDDYNSDAFKTAVANVVSPDIFYAGTSAPTNTNLLWIDTNSTTGGLKYYNGTTWVHVPVAYT